MHTQSTQSLRTRSWSTSAVAVVMAALGRKAQADARRGMISRRSRYGLEQTAQRIASALSEHGMAVFVRVNRPGAGQALILVLESSQGGTPVLMRGDGANPWTELPLRLELRACDDGASEVLIPLSAAERRGHWPAALAADLARLPELVEVALA